MEDTGITGTAVLIVETQASLLGLACVRGYL